MVTRNSEGPITQATEGTLGTSVVVRKENEAPANAVWSATGHRLPDLNEVVPATLVVSLDDAASMLGICKRTIERERDRGMLKCLRIGRHWKVRVGEIHAYLRRMEAESR